MNLKWLKAGGKTLWVALGLLAALVMYASFSGRGDVSGASAEERRIAEVLGAIAGAGDVEVALYYGRADAGGFGDSGREPVGAVIVASGAGDWDVRLSLIRAVRTLLSLPESAVDVFAMEDEG